MIRHMLKLQIFGGLKKLHFWQNHEEVLNSELYKGHMHGSRGEVM